MDRAQGHLQTDICDLEKVYRNTQVAGQCSELSLPGTEERSLPSLQVHWGAQPQPIWVQRNSLIGLLAQTLQPVKTVI